MKEAKILVLDDEPSICKLMKNVLKKETYLVSTAENGEEGIRYLKQNPVDLVITDINMPKMNGIEVLKHVKKYYPNIEVIVITGQGSTETAIESFKEGAYDYITKPLNVEELFHIVERALEKKELNITTALYEASKLFFTSDSLDELLSHLIEPVIEFIHAERVSCMILDEKENLNLHSKYGFELTNRSAIELEKCLSGRVLENGVPRIVNGSLSKYREFKGLNSNHEIKSAIIYPIIGKNAKYGVINLSRVNTEVTFTEYDLKIFSIFASDLVLALENWRLNEELRKKLEKAEANLINSDKLSLIGNLASSIAHELKNPLGVIGSCSQLCIEKFPVEEKVKEHLEVINRNALTASNLIKNMLDFSKPKIMNLEEINFSELLDDSIKMLNPKALNAKVEILKKYPAKIGSFKVDRDKLRQALMNFMINSIEAMPDGGNLIVSTYKEKKYIKIKFTDNGIGISKENINRLGEPFFTTKENGTGLGLLVSFQIIEAHRGKVEIESEKNKGTSVTISLPKE